MRVPTKRPNTAAYQYPDHLRSQVLAAPKAPGVYLFYSDNNDLPLYIGKSIDIRARLLSHLRTPAEARLLQQARRIEYRQTAGEIGALLLESRLIKELQPLTNKRLRRQRRLCSIQLVNDNVELVDTTSLSSGAELYGLFRSRKAATQALLKLADEYQLCLTHLGIERPNSRPCFRAQLGKCAGACYGGETVQTHNARLRQALQGWIVHHWPYAGPIALHETFEDLEDYHVINQWHYLGTYSDAQQARTASTQAVQPFDADSYRILMRPVLFGSAQLIKLF
ncbi:endonuclease [Pseudomonas sp. TTU2014-080ASC]|uniref:endonuclease n=1 Tax=Pseudomonas sp. TTU2014-080ASC TaxID=1729724 RepID=UPI00071866A4|nr:endonuclease [Pseudomonas sp. TTU2014-080ASC]KRW62018.1 endonuclease [Pseudomonas sp. TTU2014-080ASC]